MTRINLIPPHQLTDEHLLAEHREIKRIPNQAHRFNIDKPISDYYILGTGHVKSFSNKLLFLHKRYIDIYNECIKRGFNVQSFHSAFDNLPSHLYNDYTPKKEEILISLGRITEKILINLTHYHYYGKRLYDKNTHHFNKYNVLMNTTPNFIESLYDLNI